MFKSLFRLLWDEINIYKPTTFDSLLDGCFFLHSCVLLKLLETVSFLLTGENVNPSLENFIKSPSFMCKSILKIEILLAFCLSRRSPGSDSTLGLLFPIYFQDLVFFFCIGNFYSRKERVRMAERSKAPDSRWLTFPLSSREHRHSGLLMKAWVQIPLLTAK